MVLNLFNRDKVYSPKDKIGEYTILDILGEGRFGICYLISKDEKLYILKQLKKDMLKKIGSKVVYEEEILKSIKHEDIPQFINRIEEYKFLGYILEYKKGKTLEEIIYNEEYVFKREEIYNIAKQLIHILEYLHHKGIVHRDIRVPNTLYNNGKIALVDFGLARWVNEEKYKVQEDFSYMGDFLIHLYYTSYEDKGVKEKPWYEELELLEEERYFLKRLMKLEKEYNNINEVKGDFYKIIESLV